ncbi:sulfite exporter TauE/SafE family protein, partial [Nitrospinota bacterium]
MSETEWILTAVIVFMGGIVKGSIGFGLPAFSIPFLSLILGPRDAVVMLSLSALVTNIDYVRRGLSEWRGILEVLPYFAVGIVCVPLGVLFLQRGNPDLVRLIIGLVVYAYLAARRHLPEMGSLGTVARGGAGVGFGLLAGFMGGMASVPGPVSIVYLSMFNFSKDAFVFVINAFNTVSITTAVTTFALHGEYTPPVLLRASITLVPVYLGFWAGVRMRDRLSQE